MQYLRNLKDSISTLPKVGPSATKCYSEMGIFTFSDLLSLSPRAWEDRSMIHALGELEDGMTANTLVEVVAHSYFGPKFSNKRTLKILVKDVSQKGYGRLSLVCFGRNFLEKTLKVGHIYYLYGTVSRHMGELQCSQFEMTPATEDGDFPDSFGKILPIYPLKGTLSQRIIRRDVLAILSKVDRFEEELPLSIRTKHSLLSFDEALRIWHFPPSLSSHDHARKTLAFSELFYLQLVARRRNVSLARGTSQGPSTPTKLELKFIEDLPFPLTADQMTVLKEIRKDLDSEQAMNRLLQGDVGSGKTLVAWISSLHVLSTGAQVAFMAPTELLSRQHAESAARLLEPLGIRIAFLTGSVKGKERKLLLQAIAKGNVDIIIGTHALFSKEVSFKNLRYVIIDEQHRFGVEQRLALLQKAEVPDLLLMTATPIPRTLSLTVFGNLNVSTIRTMPPQRVPIVTHLVSEGSRERMYKAISVEFKRGHQAYFVYPRIDDTGESNLRDVTNMFEFLKEHYPQVPSALIHSKLDEEEKMAILKNYQEGKLQYLVSTSVVEVGIDIPNATCMVIEHADRFGLSALHQLRGRVGRSHLQSYCFLVFGNDLTDDAKQRLKVMKESNDGFYIAEQDLVIRGPGEITGTRQSGFLRLHYASLSEDLDLIEQARKEADRILLTDPAFLTEDNSVIRRTLSESSPFEEENQEVF
ncbi:ATP-dependent DNA helicase RecG [Sphaerochaeta pleomorpha str. Grapes]|uniref:ATP-dependent DNA helicase RecG n=1 Tax=Sphaerochaeta pleomorpha (strain ATCC BAA-1885 / DSM 22778 / Grapes) TaxID=158190 RepID=G8QR03_SPHPG|nr:ATP-dependent DNA helicase RecG [Sphaerochaeta pleomorpha]AEV29851.1 ATP-dependent DNA helicase RecG [Sphaerochaeta pleomorpha str. Grapes]